MVFILLRPKSMPVQSQCHALENSETSSASNPLPQLAKLEEYRFQVQTTKAMLIE